jgi:hypothetical protein
VNNKVQRSIVQINNNSSTAKHVEAKTESILPLLVFIYFTHLALITPTPTHHAHHTGLQAARAHEQEWRWRRQISSVNLSSTEAKRKGLIPKATKMGRCQKPSH